MQLQSGTAQLQAELLRSQARLAELEAQVRVEAGLQWEGGAVRAGRLLRGPKGPSLLLSQVRKLELERAQHKLLLETLQQRHQADLELIENAHRYPVQGLRGAPRLLACPGRVLGEALPVAALTF